MNITNHQLCDVSSHTQVLRSCASWISVQINKVNIVCDILSSSCHVSQYLPCTMDQTEGRARTHTHTHTHKQIKICLLPSLKPLFFFILSLTFSPSLHFSRRLVGSAAVVCVYMVVCVCVSLWLTYGFISCGGGEPCNCGWIIEAGVDTTMGAPWLHTHTHTHT